MNIESNLTPICKINRIWRSVGDVILPRKQGNLKPKETLQSRARGLTCFNVNEDNKDSDELKIR